MEGKRRLLRHDYTVSASKENIYDMGYRNNWRQVMGYNPRMWFIPVVDAGTFAVVGDGYEFPINLDIYRRL